MMSQKKGRLRQCRGNMLVLVAVVTCLILVPLFLLQSQIGLFMVDNKRVETVVEGACLMAANDLSRIIINDPHFGYVSLSNYPATGAGTLAPDGEPLPVTGINTLVATIRQNAIIAQELNNSTMQEMAETDRRYLVGTIASLNRALETSLRARKKAKFYDMHGKEVDPLKDATTFMKANLPEGTELKWIRLSSGWLADGGGTSSIKAPEPHRFAYAREEMLQGDEFKPFINIPFANREYTFAGLSSSSRIVPGDRFRKRNRDHINSIVLLECHVGRKDNQAAGLKLKNTMRLSACCQPYAMPDTGARGVMTLRLTGGPVSGLRSWSDFLNERTFSDNRVTSYRSVKGDYPLDRSARMVKYRGRALSTPGTAAQFASSLYCWLRNGNTRPRIDSVLDMTSEYIKLNPKDIYLYEFAKDGTISRRLLLKDPFPKGVTAEMQVSTTADTRIQGGLSPVIIFKNNVRYLGTTYGGKHCGQPLPGNPLNWCELSEYGGDQGTAKELGKGRLSTRLTVANPFSLTNSGNLFQRFDGKPLAAQPRRSLYSGGLALDIEIGGTTPPDMKRDVISMRKLPR